MPRELMRGRHEAEASISRIMWASVDNGLDDKGSLLTVAS